MSTAFTGLAIATGYERSYGVLSRLGTTPLTRVQLLFAKTLGVLAVEVIQAVLIGLVGLALGWDLHGQPAAAVLLLALGTAAFSGLGLLMAGTLRAEATLAGANGLYLVLLLLGGVVFPLTRLPGWLQAIAHVLPTPALSHGVRVALSPGGGLDGSDVLVLVVWAIAALALAARTFRWRA
jgi:ABC-2 type transport system permease protein